ncbi:MAG: branched-chain amino acid ABC transporter permease [Pseudomonadota bacterium]|nr:branched-chain amino acid ABC transporter permease [Pseudomonadota bacterium]
MSAAGPLPRDLIVVPVSVTALAAFVWLFLYAENVWLVIGLIVFAVAAGFIAYRSRGIARCERALASYPRLASALAMAAVLAVAGFFYDQPYPLLMLCTVLLFIVACLGLNIQSGYCGIVNFAGAAFFGTGAYTAAALAAIHGTPHLVLIIAGGVIAALVGSLLILPVLRTHGYYAALITIAFGILFSTFLEVNNALGGPQGLKLPGINLFGWVFNDDFTIGRVTISFYMSYLALSLALAALAFTFVRRIERSWIGLNFDAVRLDETAAATFGISIARWKILAFTFGNFLCGIAGAIYAMMQGFIAPNNFTFGDSLIMVSILILGGIGNPLGIVPAAAIIIMVPQKLQFIQEYRFLLYGILVILILLFRPEGLLPRQVRDYFPDSSP